MKNSILFKIADEFKKIKEIKALVLGGSSSGGTPDNLSDFDIYIYSETEVDVELRKQIAQKFSDFYEIDNRYFEVGDEWILRDSEMQVDIMYRSTEWIENQIQNVWFKHNASLGYTSCFIYNIKNSEILFDTDDWFKNLQVLLFGEYPKELSNNIIKKNLPMLKDKLCASYFEQIKKAIKRDDSISVNHRIAAFLASYFDILFAKNKILHPGEKKLIPFVLNNCKIIPNDFEKNIKHLTTASSDDIINTLNYMIDELKKVL